jgi:hypothetical protein
MRILAAAWRQGSLPLDEVASRGFGSTASGRQIDRESGAALNWV